MIVGTNSMPTRIPNLRCGEEGKLIQYKVFKCNTAELWEQHNCGTAGLWGGYEVALGEGSSPARQLCSVLLHFGLLQSCLSWSALPACSALARCLRCFSSSQRNTVLNLQWTGKVRSPRQRELANVERSLCPWSLIGPSSCKWGIQILTVWLFQKALSWLVRMAPLWLVGEDANEDIAAQLWLDKVSVLLVQIVSQEVLYKGWLSW